MAPRTPVILGLLAWMGPIFATICQESSVGMASGGMRTLGDGEIEDTRARLGVVAGMKGDIW
eukprot:1323854-Amorphochlora_amoeboformis.AAC.1